MNKELKDAIVYLKHELDMMEKRKIEIKKTVNLINGLNGELPTYPAYESEREPVHTSV